MKSRFFNSNAIGLITLSCWLISSLLPVQANPDNPNRSNNQPEKGWSLWQRWNKIKNVNFGIGLSNMDLGAMMDFENVCFGEVNTPNVETKKSENYWFRVSDNVNEYGLGDVEIGCWQNGKFKLTQTVTAIKNGWTFEDVYCRRVRVERDDGLAIRSEPNTNSRVVGRLKNGQTLELANIPPTIKTEGERNWIQIKSPVEGWVSNGMPGSKGNIGLCKKLP